MNSKANCNKINQNLINKSKILSNCNLVSNKKKKLSIKSIKKFIRKMRKCKIKKIK